MRLSSLQHIDFNKLPSLRSRYHKSQISSPLLGDNRFLKPSDCRHLVRSSSPQRPLTIWQRDRFHSPNKARPHEPLARSLVAPTTSSNPQTSLHRLGFHSLGPLSRFAPTDSPRRDSSASVFVRLNLVWKEIKRSLAASLPSSFSEAAKRYIDCRRTSTSTNTTPNPRRPRHHG